jgi:hypothetical protein
MSFKNAKNKNAGGCSADSLKMLQSAITDLNVALNGSDIEVQKRFGLVSKSYSYVKVGGVKVNCQDLRIQLLAGSVLAMIFGMVYCGIDGQKIFSDIEKKFFPGTPECEEYSVKCRLSDNVQYVIYTLGQMLKVKEATVFVESPWEWMKGYTSLWYLKTVVDIGKVLVKLNFGLLPLCQILFFDKSVPEKEKKGSIETFFVKLFEKKPELAFVEQQLFQ